MAGQGRTGIGLGSMVTVWLVAVGMAMPAPAAPGRPGVLPAQSGRLVDDPMGSDLMRSDARLADCCFVDPQHGWAVGDRGTIWHTDDGGGQWQLQPSGVACRLESVFFLDAQTGWAAGGHSHPYTHTSTGVVLLTRDGGRHWHQDAKLLLPALKRIRFFDEKHGWAIGCPSAMFPSGVFFTDDGGRSWAPLPGEKTAGWLAGDFFAPYNGVLADRGGMAATVRRGGIRPAQTPRFGLRALKRVHLVREVQPQLYGWMVGEGGLVMMTQDAGATWQTPPGELPDGVPQQFDFSALAVVGPRAWVAGSPGSRILHSPDAGRSWVALPTGQNLPIRGLCFVDEQNGWAVGELGTILATSDGGQSWHRQRSGGTRAALLGMFSEPQDVPLELFARLCGNEGYLGVVELLNRRDVETPPRDDVHVADRAHEAVVGVGGCGVDSAWRFPLRQLGLELAARQIVDGWDLANDGRGINELEAYVVRQIRLWRPEVIVTHDASPAGDDPLGHLVNQVVLQAVQLAADPTSHAEQITRAGLEPWKVKKVYAALKPGVAGATNLTTSQLAGRLGRSLADVAATPRGLLADRFSVAPETLGFRMLVDQLPQQQGRGDFFTGIVLHPGGEARRELLQPAAGSVDLIRRIAQKCRNTRAILERTAEDPQGGVGLLAQAGELTRGLDPESAAGILYHLGQRYCRTGHWPLAAEAFELLADRHPEHPLARPALVWLVQYYASSEAAWRVQGAQRMTVQQTSAPAVDFSGQENRPERASGFGHQIEQTRPVLFAEPALRFPLAVADRLRGFPRQAERFYLARQRSATRDAWWACAQGEAWLAEPKGLPPKPVLTCAATASKPRLDGRLDDAVWQRAKAAELRSPLDDDDPWPAAVLLAYDAEFLYVGVQCRQAPGGRYPAGEGPRPRDPDLSGHDRIDLLVDLDRDFTTYYRLSIDHRGWTGDECWGDATWDPAWFVAATTNDGLWTAEAAIPLEQLTGRFPASRAVWAIGIQRVVPGVGFQSWNTPATAEVTPEGFGYLIFE